MRPQRPIAAALAVVLLLAVALGVLFSLDSDERRSEVLAVDPSSAGAQPSATAGPTGTPTPTTTNTPQPAPTFTPQPTPPPTIEQPPIQHTHPPPPVQQEPTPAPAREWLDPDFAGRVLALVNAERTSRGLLALVVSGPLTESAQTYARTLLRYDSLSHSADGTSLSGRVQAAGYDTLPLAELLWGGTGAMPPERVVSDWMASPTHRVIILDPRFQVAGTGCAFREGDRLRTRCVMDLGG